MLKIQFKDGRAEPIALVDPGMTIGKGRINDIVINEEGVNSFHADLRVDGDQITISDVNTETGTFLNGELLSGPTNLRIGDVISIQGVDLAVLDDDTVAEGVDTTAKTLVLSGAAVQEANEGGWMLIAGSGPEKGQLIPINTSTEIGRALDCDISILEPSLSRKHAQIEPVENKLIIRDLESANGTYVNGKKIQEVELKNEDVLQFDKIRFIVRGPV